MTDSEIETFELYRDLTERAARAEREALVLQQQLTQKNTDAQNLRARAKVLAMELGLTCA